MVASVRIERGEFVRVAKHTDTLLEFGESFENDDAMVCHHELVARYNLKVRRPAESIRAARAGIELAEKLGQREMVFFFEGIIAQTNLMMGQTDEAYALIKKIEHTLSRNGFIPNHFTCRYVIARASYFASELERGDSRGVRRAARKSTKRAVTMIKRYAADAVEALRLRGAYFWLTGRKRKAAASYALALEKGKVLGAKLELSRTYFEVGRRLASDVPGLGSYLPKSSREYLEEAESLFLEMELEWDLSRLREFRAEHGTEASQA